MSRRVAVLLLLAASLLVVTGSGGFSVTSADRDLRVGVGHDERALLGVETEAPKLRAGHHRNVALVTLANNFQSDVTAVNARVKNIRGGPPPHATSKRPAEPSRIGVGEAAAVTVDVTCGGQARTEQVDVDVLVTTAGGSDVKLTREVPVTCTGEPDRGASGESRTARETWQGERERRGADRRDGHGPRERRERGGVDREHERPANDSGDGSTESGRDSHRDRDGRDAHRRR